MNVFDVLCIFDDNDDHEDDKGKNHFIPARGFLSTLIIRPVGNKFE